MSEIEMKKRLGIHSNIKGQFGDPEPHFVCSHGYSTRFKACGKI